MLGVHVHHTWRLRAPVVCLKPSRRGRWQASMNSSKLISPERACSDCESHRALGHPGPPITPAVAGLVELRDDLRYIALVWQPTKRGKPAQLACRATQLHVDASNGDRNHGHVRLCDVYTIDALRQSFRRNQDYQESVHHASHATPGPSQYRPRTRIATSSSLAEMAPFSSCKETAKAHRALRRSARRFPVSRSASWKKKGSRSCSMPLGVLHRARQTLPRETNSAGSFFPDTLRQPGCGQDLGLARCPAQHGGEPAKARERRGETLRRVILVLLSARRPIRRGAGISRRGQRCERKGGQRCTCSGSRLPFHCAWHKMLAINKFRAAAAEAATEAVVPNASSRINRMALHVL